MGNEWTSEYYDAIEFYYWEPQRLGKTKNSRYKNKNDVLAHLQNIEVPLNHILNFFFRLVPANFTKSFVNTTCNVNITETLSLMGRNEITEFCRLVQPDLLFSSRNTDFSIELKINAQSSKEQVYKYALLHWLEQQQSKNKKQSFLLYIGKRNFQNLWSEKYSTTEELLEATLRMDIDKLMRKANNQENIEIDWDGVEKVLENSIISYCTYGEFGAFLTTYRKQIPVDQEYSETLLKLIDGLYYELKKRKLA